MVFPMGAYADPKNDVAFKKLFGDRSHDAILIDFLNDVLERTVITKIESVSITDPHNLPLALGLKASIVDVRCFDDQNRHYQIEMQVAPQIDYGERCQFYTSYFIAKQLEKKRPYQDLEPIIFISILDFELFAHKHFLSHHLIMDTKTHEQSLKLVEYHFLELPKFKKTATELKFDVDRWAYFFKYAGGADSIPVPLAKDKIIVEAFEILKRAAWKEVDLDLYIQALDAELSAESIINTARMQGELDVVIKLLEAGVSEDLILKSTNLTFDEIKKLKK